MRDSIYLPKRVRCEVVHHGSVVFAEDNLCMQEMFASFPHNSAEIAHMLNNASLPLLKCLMRTIIREPLGRTAKASATSLSTLEPAGDRRRM